MRLQSVKILPILFVSAILAVAFAAAAEKANGQISKVDYLMGNFKPNRDAEFVVIDKAYTAKTNIYLRRPAYAAFKKMYAQALKDTKVKLTVLSATRNFDYQKRIWERKWTAYSNIEGSKYRTLEILKYSAMPGASRHHWGTDLDLVSLNDSHFQSRAGKRIYEWLQANALKYGFCQPYTAGRPTGYNEEKWHWSYKPLSKDLSEEAGSLITNAMITGFSGADTAEEIDIVNKYILGINPGCR